MFICQNSEGVHAYLLKCCRGTCSFVGMLKGYMVRERLGTPVLDNTVFTFFLFLGSELVDTAPSLFTVTLISYCSIVFC